MSQVRVVEVRRLLCRLFRLTRNEDVPVLAVWERVTAAKELRPFWPRVVKSDVWISELLPWYHHVLGRTLYDLAKAKDERLIRDLQVTAWVLSMIIEQPQTALKHDDFKLRQQFMTGEAEFPAGVTNGR